MLIDLTPYKNPDAVRDLVASFPDAKKYYGQRNPIESAKSIGSSGSMFRVFRGIEEPSHIYKQWAFDQTQSKDFESKVLSLNPQEQFEKLHSAMGDSLSDYWKNNAKGDGKEKMLTPSHKLKLLDVFIKRACELKLPKAAMNDNPYSPPHRIHLRNIRKINLRPVHRQVVDPTRVTLIDLDRLAAARRYSHQSNGRKRSHVLDISEVVDVRVRNDELLRVIDRSSELNRCATLLRDLHQRRLTTAVHLAEIQIIRVLRETETRGP